MQMAREGQLVKQSGIWDRYTTPEKHSQNLSVIKFGIVFWPRCLANNKNPARCSSPDEKMVWDLDALSDAEPTRWGWDRSNRGIFLYSENSWSVQPVMETHPGCCVWGLNCGPALCYAAFLCPSRHQQGLFLGPFQCSPWSFLHAHFHVHACLSFIAFVIQACLKQVFISTAWDQ